MANCKKGIFEVNFVYTYLKEAESNGHSIFFFMKWNRYVVIEEKIKSFSVSLDGKEKGEERQKTIITIKTKKWF